MRTFDAADASTVLAARAVIADGVDRILYSEPTPNPGSWCTWCPVATWCVARQTAVIEPDDAPVQESAAGPSRVALLSYAETAIIVDDDIPF